MSANKRLAELAIQLPENNNPAANYIPYTSVGNMVFIAGQTCKWNGKLQYAGKIGRDYTTEQGKEAAHLCGLNIIMQIKNACGGDLDIVRKCARLNIYLNCTDDFTEHAAVANGISDLIVDVFGEKGRHTRVTSGSNSLPGNTAVEVDAIFEVDAA
ncbi:MAG: RidA family protein [Rickettsiaceae bacterium]|jgi:enamine deaminase RidA (YjgF/YER057c/UK114 family)|nr:RidA family protein [Rickettsiaceae bacterium]